MIAIEIFEQIYSHIRAGEWDEINKYLADDFVAHEPENLPFGGKWSGDNVFKRLFTAVMGAFEEPKVEPISMIGGDEWVCYALHFSVTSKSTGKRHTYRTIEHGRIVDGKLKELHLHYFDTAQMVKELEF